MAILCCYCGAEITLKKKKVPHINICREPPIIYFCNQDCKINWVFNKSDIKLNKYINTNLSKKEVKYNFDMEIIEDKSYELESYLEENNLKILREA